MEVAAFSPNTVGPEVEFFANKLDECLDLQRTALSVAKKRDGILRMVNSYYTYAADQAARHRPSDSRASKLLRSSTPAHSEPDTEPDTEIMDVDTAGSDSHKHWEHEAQTWDLLRRLLPLRYPEPAGSRKATRSSTFRQSLGSTTRQNAWDEFLLSDPSAVERRAVLQWLQNNAASSGPDISELVQELQQQADRGDIIAHGWIHTRSAIKRQKMLLTLTRATVLDPADAATTDALRTAAGSPLVTQLDPDAVTRQGRKLQPQDEYFERAVWRGCFELLRRGSTMETLRDWCAERTEAWRAVSMSALPLPGVDADKPLHGPASIALWRRMCYATARNGGVDDYERAVYGLLAGDIPSVEKVCASWDDVLFANYNALLRSQFDHFALSMCGPEAAASLTQTFASFDAVQYHGDAATLEKRLIKAMEANPLTGAEAKTPNKVLQGAVLARDLESYFVDQGLALACNALGGPDADILLTGGLNTLQVDTSKVFDSDQMHGLRLASHVYIVCNMLDKLLDTSYNSTGDSARKDVQGNVVVAYLNMISNAQMEELMPMYCSTLAGDRQYQVLSRHLLKITDTESRLAALNIIRRSGLDVLKFVSMQPALHLDALVKTAFPAAADFNIMLDAEPQVDSGRSMKIDFMGSPDDVPERHMDLIRSVEWLLLVDEAWPEVLSKASQVYKYFLSMYYYALEEEEEEGKGKLTRTENMHLASARALLASVSFDDFFKTRAAKFDLDIDTTVAYNPEDTEFWAAHLGEDPDFTLLKKTTTDARNFRDLAALVKSLDYIETVNSLRWIIEDRCRKQQPTHDLWTEVAKNVKQCRESIEPVINGWLLKSIEENDKDLEIIRALFLPETVLAWVTTLHFASSHLGKDYLLESLDLAAVIADGRSDVADAFVTAGRMTELVQAFTACSKALAVSTKEKKTGPASKRLRESGWSRDLWSV
ncbi:hypothetical protein TD95_001910 [Thielaviopsis punctulata]|uniref:Nuclear pore complex protein n=1 Tax=Thielaviopsis punctulata TaxID=72032 RepID=A0A0F4ZJ40_9PEZI|nr:hypothetical protein TD95_001910 [Thielaviopsis punctulata]